MKKERKQKGTLDTDSWKSASHLKSTAPGASSQTHQYSKDNVVEPSQNSLTGPLPDPIETAAAILKKELG